MSDPILYSDIIKFVLKTVWGHCIVEMGSFVVVGEKLFFRT